MAGQPKPLSVINVAASIPVITALNVRHRFVFDKPLISAIMAILIETFLGGLVL